MSRLLFFSTFITSSVFSRFAISSAISVSNRCCFSVSFSSRRNLRACLFEPLSARSKRSHLLASPSSTLRSALAVSSIENTSESTMSRRAIKRSEAWFTADKERVLSYTIHVADSNTMASNA